jgi:hypothetical protein
MMYDAIVVFIVLHFRHDKELSSWDKELSLVTQSPYRSFGSFQGQEV